MILRILFWCLFWKQICSSPIRHFSSASTDSEVLDSFELKLGSDEQASPFDDRLKEGTEMQITPRAGDEMSQSDTEFFDYLDSLPGTELQELDAIFEEDSSYFPSLTETDQNCLKVSLIKDTFFRTDISIPPHLKFRKFVLLFNYNWPQASQTLVEMSTLTCQAYQLFFSLVLEKNVKKLAVLFKYKMIDLSRPVYSQKERLYYSIPSFWIYFLDPASEVLELIITATETLAPSAINAHSGDGLTAIHSAIIKRNLRVLPVLVHAGADVNILYGNFGTAAMHAIMNRNFDALHFLAKLGTTNLTLTTPNNRDIFDFILEFRSLKGMEVIIQAHSPFPYNRMLQFFQKAFAVDAEFAKSCCNSLIAHDKFSVLLTAVYPTIIEKGYLEACHRLVAFKILPNPTLFDASGRQTTPLHIAANAGHNEIVELLLGLGHLPTILDSTQLLPIELAAAKGHLLTVEALIKAAGNTHIERALIAAIQGNQIDVVRNLLSSSGNLDHLRIDGKSLWQWAYDNGQYRLFQSLFDNVNFDPDYRVSDVISLAETKFIPNSICEELVRKYIIKYQNTRS